MTKYRVIRNTAFHKAGEIVYSLRYADYGLANDDSRRTGEPHRSVTYKEDGDYPSATIPASALEKI
jgi:hypothetical protein